MRIVELIEESISVLKSNRMRTALSMLGIVIGIGSVIALITLGQASQQSVKQRIQSLGSNLLIIRPGSESRGFIRDSSSGGTTLTSEDAISMSQSLRFSTIDKVAAEYSGRAQVSYEGVNDNLTIAGITENYFGLRNIEMDTGSEITEQDNLLVNKVAVIGFGLKESLFSNQDPIGKSIRVKGTTYRVLGIAKEKGSSGGDDTVYIPLKTAQKSLFGVNHLSSIYVSAKDESLMDEAKNQVGYFLLERHNIESPDKADFSILSQEDILETVSQVTGTFTTLLAGIAAISLIVGGIGIMNIMLVTVTERTREIGLRKALGAKKKDIIAQFLLESSILSGLGGVFGMILGVLASYVLTKFMSLPFSVSLTSIVLALGTSAIIGIVFGWYPAKKASDLQPIEALRYE